MDREGAYEAWNDHDAATRQRLWNRTEALTRYVPDAHTLPVYESRPFSSATLFVAKQQPPASVTSSGTRLPGLKPHPVTV